MFDSIEKNINEFLNDNGNLKMLVLMLVGFLMFIGFDDKKLNSKITQIKNNNNKNSKVK